MIEKVNLNLKGIQLRTTLRDEKPEEEQNTVTNPVEKEMSFKGRYALANYNMGMINMNNKLEVEPIVPIEILPEELDSLEGERIYTSDNQLHSIVNDDGNTVTKYLFNPEDSSEWKQIITTDKISGKIIRKQEKFTDEGNNYVRVSEYDTENGKEKGFSLYEDGKLVNAGNIDYKNNSIITTENYADGNYGISVYDSKTQSRKNAYYDKNKNIESINEYKESRNINTFSNINFYNGSIISIEKREKILVPNSMGREFLNNPELIPAEKFNIDKDYKGIKGEKTYYSNDMIESNTLEDGTVANFSPEGELEKLVFEDKEIQFDGSEQKITEILGENEKRITIYNGDFLRSVRYENGEIFKETDFSINGNPMSYRENSIDEDNKYGDMRKSLFFNEAGMLESAYL